MVLMPLGMTTEVRLLQERKASSPISDTVAGIRNALEAGISVSINTPLCTLNSNYLETLKFLHEMGVTYVTCSGLITTGNATSKESESLDSRAS